MQYNEHPADTLSNIKALNWTNTAQKHFSITFCALSEAKGMNIIMKNHAIVPPNWLARSAIYQINPRTFSKEGTIAAATKELPFLAEMGFKTMYLCPIFETDYSTDKTFWSERQKKSNTGNPKNPYRINDYYTIDEEYGSIEDLKEFVSQAHKLDMRVLLDLVYLHIGPNAHILKTHPEFAQQKDDGSFICSMYHFPLLDFKSAGLREYLWGNMTYYIGVLDVDGFRCDAADSVPNDFWIEGRRRIHAIKPDAVLINEGIKYHRMADTFDASYCFDWHENLRSVFAGEIPVSTLREKNNEHIQSSPKGGFLLRDIDNHDTVTDWEGRTELVAGHDGMEQIEVINYLIDGIPMVYCGNELGCMAKLSMFANRFYMAEYEVTDRSDLRKKDFSLRRQNIMMRLNELKRGNDILRYGSTDWLDDFESEDVIAFIRTYNGERIGFIGNTKNETREVSLDFAPLETYIMMIKDE